MPDSPCCGVPLAFGLVGGICPKCLNVYRPSAVKKMPGYNEDEVNEYMELFMLMTAAGLLGPGVNEVEIREDGFSIHLHEELD